MDGKSAGNDLQPPRVQLPRVLSTDNQLLMEGTVMGSAEIADYFATLNTSLPSPPVTDSAVSDTANVEDDQPCGQETGNPLSTSFTSVLLNDVYLALLSLYIAHVPNELLFANVIRIINILIPNEKQHIPVKLNHFLNYCKKRQLPVKQFYCANATCNSKFIGSADQRCLLCDNLPNKRSYFLYNSVSEYIKSLLEEADLDFYLHGTPNVDSAEHRTTYKDPRDGSEFKRVQSASPGCVQLLLNVDGVPLYRTSSYTLHPVTVCPLNYPLEIRRKRMHCCILWNDKRKPVYSELFKPFLQEMTALGTEGLVWLQNKDIKRTKVFLTLVTADSVARAPLQQLQQFNGKYGCPVCVTPSTPLKKTNALHRIYLYRAQPVLRTSTETLRIARSTDVRKTRPLGILGVSPLAQLPLFDVIDGFAIDSMHAVFHGVFKDLLQRILRSMSISKVEELNTRIMNVKLPQEVSRTLRPLTEFTRGNWRVSEMRTVAYLAPLLLRGLIPAAKYDNLVLFTTAMYFLHSSSISAECLPKCYRQIQRFCRHLSVVYNDKAVYTYNVHVLLHLPDKVRQAGPLFTHSCDEFEMLFAKMLSVQHGSRGASEQILRYFNVKSTLDRSSVQLAVTNQPLSQFCNRILCKHCSNFVKCVDSNTTLLGKPYYKQILGLSAESNSVSASNLTNVECFPKCVHYGTLFKIRALCKTTVRVDCYIYTRRKFFLLLDIALVDKDVFFVCNRVMVNRLCTLVTNAQLELRYPLCRIINVDSNIVSFKLSSRFTKCCSASLNNDRYLLPLPSSQHRS